MKAVRAASQEGPRAGTAKKRRTRQRLLGAAVDLVRAGQAVTLEDAASIAGLSRATAYRYFATADVLRLEAALTEALNSVDGPEAEVVRLCAQITDHADRVEATVRCMARWTWASQAALRITLMQSLDGSYRRPGHRGTWIAHALAPAAEQLGPELAEQLRRALYLLFGLEPLLPLADLLGLGQEQALDTLAFSARALMSHALREAASRRAEAATKS